MKRFEERGLRIEEKGIRFENRDFNIEGTNQRNKQILDLKSQISNLYSPKGAYT